MTKRSGEEIRNLCIELQRQMDRIIGQQRRMSHFLMLLQDEEGHDAQLDKVAGELRQLEVTLDGFADILNGLNTVEKNF